MEHFWTRWTVLLLFIIFLSSCGGSKSSTPASPTPDGTATGPIQLINLNSATTNPGQVGNTTAGSKSYYQVSVSGDTTYTITLYGLSADADLWVYDDLPFDFITGPVCKSQNGGTSNEQCVITTKTGQSTINIEVDGEFALSGATYSISVNYPVTPSGECSGPGCFNFDTNPPPLTFPGPFVLTETGSGTLVPWDLDTNTVLGTPNSIHSGGLSNAQISCFSYSTTTILPNLSYVSFDLEVSSSTQYYDLLLFYIDNVLQLPVWSGTVAPQHVMFNTTTGTHTYKWCHSNNSTGMSGDVGVDNIYIQ